MKNRVIALALAVLLMAGAAGCGSGGGLRIVVTAFPVYDWVRTILGEDTDAELVWLTDDGASLHGYEPSEEDLKTIADCDVFIYIGGPSDDWAEEAASRIRSRTATVIDLMDALGSAVGLEQDPDAGAYDEHVWLSLQNARVLTAYIAAVLEGKDPKHAEAYAANTEAYDSELMMLDMKYVGATRSAEPGVLLFGGPFAFRYMLRDYFLEYAAAFEGCPGGTAVSAETIASLAAKADELGLRAVIALSLIHI